MPPVSFVVTPPIADVVTAAGIGGLAMVMAGVVVWLRVRHERVSPWPTAAVLGLWMATTAGLALSGELARVDRPLPILAMLLPVIVGVPLLVAWSPIGRRMAAALPVVALIGLQTFRLPLELVMHRAAEIGVMPAELSYSGYNFDIVTGVGALGLFLALRATRVPRVLVWAWNLWGLYCLAVIAWIARSSSPLVRAFGDDPRHVNTWVLYFPYIWLPSVLVVIALGGHLVLTRKLLRER